MAKKPFRGVIKLDVRACRDSRSSEGGKITGLGGMPRPASFTSFNPELQVAGTVGAPLIHDQFVDCQN